MPLVSFMAAMGSGSGGGGTLGGGESWASPDMVYYVDAAASGIQMTRAPTDCLGCLCRLGCSRLGSEGRRCRRNVDGVRHEFNEETNEQREGRRCAGEPDRAPLLAAASFFFLWHTGNDQEV